MHMKFVIEVFCELLHSRNSRKLLVANILRYTVDLETMQLLIWKRQHALTAMVHLTLNLERGHRAWQGNWFCIAKTCHLKGRVVFPDAQKEVGGITGLA